MFSGMPETSNVYNSNILYWRFWVRGRRRVSRASDSRSDNVSFKLRTLEVLGKRTGCCTVSAAYKQGNSFDVKHSVRPLTSYDKLTKHAHKQNLTKVAEASISRTQLLYGARDQCAHTGVGFVGSRHNTGSNEFKSKQRHSQFSVSGLSEQTIPSRRHMCAWRKDSSLPVTKSSPDQNSTATYEG